ncbi:MAG: acyltransferase [Candidatus Lokiarchaeota archaeon]|nr:acyltransferase [Candidatus Lokiarchaeota archaeon]
MTYNMKKIYRIILSLPKSIYLNWHYLGWVGIKKLPLLFSYKVNIQNCSGKLIINGPINLGMVRIGFGNVGIFDQKYSRTVWDHHGCIVFQGSAAIGHGSKISIQKKGVLKIGHDFRISAEGTIVCHHNIDIGDQCLFAWDVLVMDTDLHKIMIKGQQINRNEAIILGDHIWIGARSLILKGSKIEKNCVVAANSLVTKAFSGENLLIAGSPAKILKQGIEWQA